MISTRLFPDRLQISRRTQVSDDYGVHDTWADHGDPIPAKLEQQSTYENVTNTDVVVGFTQALMPGEPDLLPTDRVTDQRGRTFAIEGDLDYQLNPGGSLKLTVVRLRKAENL